MTSAGAAPGNRLHAAQRSLLAALEITSLATGAHLLAGGELPTPGFLLGLGLVVFLCSLATIGRLVSAATVLPVVFGAQIGLHEALASAEPMHGMSGGTSTVGMLHLSPVMFWVHLVTAVVTAIVLLAQERALALVVGWLQALTATPVRAPRWARADAFAAMSRGTRRALLRTSPRRGPPVVYAHNALILAL